MGLKNSEVLHKEALKYIKKALKINNKDQRLLNNYKLIKIYNI